MKLNCYIFIAILQCILLNNLSDCLSNEKPKVVVSFRDNKELSELKCDIGIFEQSILENINLQDEICETVSNLNKYTVDSNLMNYHNWFLKNLLVITVNRNSINHLNVISLPKNIQFMINLGVNVNQSELENAIWNFLEMNINNSKDLKVLLYKYNFNVMRNIVINRSITKSFINTSFVFNIYKIFTDFSNCNSSQNYVVKINFLYVGAHISKGKYSTNIKLVINKLPKSALLIIILLLMCGDTGSSINPGPTHLNDVQTSEEFIDERYLNHIDPDNNYYNDGELDTTYFKSYTIDEFK